MEQHKEPSWLRISVSRVLLKSDRMLGDNETWFCLGRVFVSRQSKPHGFTRWHRYGKGVTLSGGRNSIIMPESLYYRQKADRTGAMRVVCKGLAEWGIGGGEVEERVKSSLITTPLGGVCPWWEELQAWGVMEPWNHYRTGVGGEVTWRRRGSLPAADVPPFVARTALSTFDPLFFFINAIIKQNSLAPKYKERIIQGVDPK